MRLPIHPRTLAKLVALGIIISGAASVPASAGIEAITDSVAQQTRVASVADRLAAAENSVCRQLSFPTNEISPVVIGCASKVVLIQREDVNAWADGTRIIITNSMVEQCGSDADLALVIAHEMAHNLLHHRQRLAAVVSLEGGPSPLTAARARQMQETEEEADQLGVTLATAAGYDLRGAAGFLDGLLNPRDGPRRHAATHPGSERRLSLLRSAIAEQALSKPQSVRL